MDCGTRRASGTFLGDGEMDELNPAVHFLAARKN